MVIYVTLPCVIQTHVVRVNVASPTIMVFVTALIPTTSVRIVISMIAKILTVGQTVIPKSYLIGYAIVTATQTTGVHYVNTKLLPHMVMTVTMT